MTDKATVEEIIRYIGYYHMAGVMIGGACDRGYCECPKIIDSIKKEFES